MLNPTSAKFYLHVNTFIVALLTIFEPTENLHLLFTAYYQNPVKGDKGY